MKRFNTSNSNHILLTLPQMTTTVLSILHMIFNDI